MKIMFKFVCSIIVFKFLNIYNLKRKSESNQNSLKELLKVLKSSK